MLFDRNRKSRNQTEGQQDPERESRRGAIAESKTSKDAPLQEPLVRRVPRSYGAVRATHVFVEVTTNETSARQAPIAEWRPNISRSHSSKRVLSISSRCRLPFLCELFHLRSLSVRLPPCVSYPPLSLSLYLLCCSRPARCYCPC